MLKQRAGSLWNDLKQAGKDWNNDKVPRLGAALAYYSIFSIAPLLILLISVAALIIGRGESQAQLLEWIQSQVGPQGAEALKSMLDNATKPGSGITAATVGVLTLLLGASGVLFQLQDALNTIWRVDPNANAGIWATVKARLVGFGLILVVGALMVASLLATAALGVVSQFFTNLLPGSEALWQLANFAVSFAVTTALFAMIFKLLPQIKISWRATLPGAALTSLLFSIGKFGLGLYLAHGSVGSVYGAAGSLVMLLVWIYYSSQILLFGAEFTRVYSARHGSKGDTDRAESNGSKLGVKYEPFAAGRAS